VPQQPAAQGGEPELRAEGQSSARRGCTRARSSATRKGLWTHVAPRARGMRRGGPGRPRPTHSRVIGQRPRQASSCQGVAAAHRARAGLRTQPLGAGSRLPAGQHSAAVYSKGTKRVRSVADLKECMYLVQPCRPAARQGTWVVGRTEPPCQRMCSAWRSSWDFHVWLLLWELG